MVQVNLNQIKQGGVGNPPGPGPRNNNNTSPSSPPPNKKPLFPSEGVSYSNLKSVENKEVVMTKEIIVTKEWVESVEKVLKVFEGLAGKGLREGDECVCWHCRTFEARVGDMVRKAVK
jgi:hypothetical protein